MTGKKATKKLKKSKKLESKKTLTLGIKFIKGGI